MHSKVEIPRATLIALLIAGRKLLDLQPDEAHSKLIDAINDADLRLMIDKAYEKCTQYTDEDRQRARANAGY